MITLTIKDGDFKRDLERFAKKSGKEFQMAITDSTTQMHRLAQKKIRQHAKGGTGFLRNNVLMEISSNKMTGTVTSHAAYSQAFEEGTRPHGIQIKNKKVLAGPKRKAPPGWENISGDYAIYGKKIQHPGTIPHPFMFPAWKSACLHLEKMIRKVFR